MKGMRGGASIAAIGLLMLGVAATPNVVDVAQAQRQPQAPASPTPPPGQEQQQQRPQGQLMQGTQALGQLLDVVIANSHVLNQALNDERVVDRLVMGGQRGAQDGQQATQGGQRGSQPADQQVRVMYLGEMMNRGDADLLSQLLNSSNALARNAVVARTVAANNQQLQAFMQRNGIARNRLVALDVIGQPATLYVMGTSQGTGQGTTDRQNQDTQPGQRGGSPGQNTAPQASPTPRPRG